MKLIVKLYSASMSFDNLTTVSKLTTLLNSLKLYVRYINSEIYS